MYKNPLSGYEEDLDSAEDLRDEISRQVRNGAVDDYASKNLSQIRKQIVKCEEQMKQKAGQIMNTNKNIWQTVITHSAMAGCVSL